jgi:Holliday junction resolvase RusA-like endonuclease
MYEPESGSYVFYQCRYYNELIGTMEDFPIPTTQTKNKLKKKEFKERMIFLLKEINNEKWPYKEKLTIAVNISGNKSYITRIDIDNVLKNLIDILKGIVFIDDKQIFSIMADKQENVKDGLMIGIRLLKDDEINNCIPPMIGPYEKDKLKDDSTTMWTAVELSPSSTNNVE